MVAFITLLTYLVACLLGLTAAAPHLDASVMLPVNDSSLEQPHIEWLSNNIFVADPNHPIVSLHVTFFKYRNSLTLPKNPASLYKYSLQILLQRIGPKTHYYVFW
jgi:hypothetical protein